MWQSYDHLDLSQFLLCGFAVHYNPVFLSELSSGASRHKMYLFALLIAIELQAFVSANPDTGILMFLQPLRQSIRQPGRNYESDCYRGYCILAMQGAPSSVAFAARCCKPYLF